MVAWLIVSDGIAPVSTPVEVETAGSIQDVAISGRFSGSEVSWTWAGELITLASSTAASSGSLPGVAARYPSGSLDLAEASMASAEGSAFSTPSSGRCASGSLDLAEASMASTAGSAVSTRCSSGSLDLAETSMASTTGSAFPTRCASGSLDLAEASMASTTGSAFPTVLVARDTLGLAALGMLAMFFEVLL